jgi:hypothetical protein
MGCGGGGSRESEILTQQVNYIVRRDAIYRLNIILKLYILTVCRLAPFIYNEYLLKLQVAVSSLRFNLIDLKNHRYACKMRKSPQWLVNIYD